MINVFDPMERANDLRVVETCEELLSKRMHHTHSILGFIPIWRPTTFIERTLATAVIHLIKEKHGIQ